MKGIINSIKKETLHKANEEPMWNWFCSKPGSSETEIACWMQLTVDGGKTLHKSKYKR